jgi:hypothetical protein
MLGAPPSKPKSMAGFGFGEVPTWRLAIFHMLRTGTKD